MKKVFCLAAVFAVLWSAALAVETAPRQITVSGEGLVEVVPDMAVIALGVTNAADTAVAAMDATSESVARVLQHLGAAGIAPRDLQTQRISLNPIWSDRSRSVTGQAEISGFVASNLIQVRVRDLDRLGQILQAAIGDGANDFNGLRFSVQEAGPLQDRARKAAVADATAKARLFAEAAGVSLGPVLSINESGAGGRPVIMAMERAAMRDAVPVAAGELEISASVTMVFAIAD